MERTNFIAVPNIKCRGLGCGDLFLTDRGLYFILYDPGLDTVRLSDSKREIEWGVGIEDRIGRHPGSFFLKRPDLLAPDFYNQKVEIRDERTGLTTSSEYRTFQVKAADIAYDFCDPNIHGNRMKEAEEKIRAYFKSKHLFEISAYEKNGLHIAHPAPVIVIDLAQSGKPKNEILPEALSKAAGDAAYMTRFYRIFLHRVAREKRPEALDQLVRFAPEAFASALESAIRADSEGSKATLKALIFLAPVAVGTFLLARSLNPGLFKGILTLAAIGLGGISLICFFLAVSGYYRNRGLLRRSSLGTKS